MIKKIILETLCVIYILFGTIYLNAQEHIYVYKQGSIAFKEKTNTIDSVALEKNKTELGFYNAPNSRFYNTPIEEIDSIVFAMEKPVADILDVVFKTDGTAEDISPMKNAITTNSSGALSTYYSNTYKRFVAKFGNTWAGATSGFYRIDYANNEAFKEALKDGHTLEAVVMADFEPPISEGEAKFFSSHETGGTGLMVCKAFRGLNGKNELSFLPHVGGDWKFAASGIVPQPQIYYHIVGTWNKEEGKARIYINGELKNTAEAAGEFKFPKDNSNWFAIGCDAGPTAQLGWSGDVVLARVYDNPLTQQEVDILWNEIKKLQENAQPDMISDIEYYSGLAVIPGQTFSIQGKGFLAGDRLRFSSITDVANNIILEGTPTETGFEINIPENLKSDKYRMLLIRNENIQDLGLIKIEIVETFPEAPGIVAHRGYWDTEGAAQNSVASFTNAQQLGLYGSETDVWLTTDGYLVLNHDEKINGISIQDATYNQIKDCTLSNNEKIPQLKDILALLKNGTTKLFIEVKAHSTTEKNIAVTKAIIDEVKAENAQDMVEYITFNLDICRELVKLNPTAKVAYLGGGMAPKDAYGLGIRGIHYHQKEYRDNPQWIKEARDLGMTVNVQGTNSVEDMAEMINLGANLISTDKPRLALKVRQYYLDNQKK